MPPKAQNRKNNPGEKDNLTQSLKLTVWYGYADWSPGTSTTGTGGPSGGLARWDRPGVPPGGRRLVRLRLSQILVKPWLRFGIIIKLGLCTSSKTRLEFWPGGGRFVSRRLGRGRRFCVQPFWPNPYGQRPQPCPQTSTAVDLLKSPRSLFPLVAGAGFQQLSPGHPARRHWFLASLHGQILTNHKLPLTGHLWHWGTVQPTPINTLIESGFVKILFSVGSLYSEIPILSFEFQNVSAETWSVVKNVPTLG